MNLLEELRAIRADLDSIPCDSIPKDRSIQWSRAMNGIMKLVAHGEYREALMNAKSTNEYAEIKRSFSSDLRGPDSARGSRP